MLDEPTSGLHLSDVETLLGVLDRLTDAGHTVVVIEHSLDVIGQADWVIDMGPGPGHHGGTVVYTGTVAGLLHAATPTGAALRRHRSVVDDPGAVR